MQPAQPDVFRTAESKSAKQALGVVCPGKMHHSDHNVVETQLEAKSIIFGDLEPLPSWNVTIRTQAFDVPIKWRQCAFLRA